MAKPDSKALRDRIRKMRRKLGDDERIRLEYQASQRLQSTPFFRNSQRVAAYVSFDGELDPAQIIAASLASGKSVYLPVLHARGQMTFAQFDNDTELRDNQFGIPEPVAQPDRMINPRWLDLVIAPLVAFGADGTRLGMGAGYYDKCFAFRLRRRKWRKPRMVGLAFEFQRDDTIAAQPWDVSMDCVVTDQTIHSNIKQEKK